MLVAVEVEEVVDRWEKCNRYAFLVFLETAASLVRREGGARLIVVGVARLTI